ncbi:MAG: hypothetical protein HDS42_02530 [Bacteroides sp.]|nr:hypothetical protein [Bacteroides sp.]
MSDFFSTDIKFLKGVGENRGKVLGKELDIHTFRDLLYYFPFRHVDRSKFYKISELNGEMPFVQIVGRFVNFQIEGEGAKRRLHGVFSDGSRMMECVWFSKVDAMKDAYKLGVDYVIFGKPQQFRSVYSISHPEVSAYDPSKPPMGFMGVYTIPETLRKRGYASRLIATLVKNLFENSRFPEIPSVIPEEVRERYNLMPLKEAILQMHTPENAAAFNKARERM